MRIILRNPRRELDVRGPIRVHALLAQLDVNPESVLVLRGDTLATSDEVLDDTDIVELRPVISGGCA
jgi:sulfur carrier protein